MHDYVFLCRRKITNLYFSRFLSASFVPTMTSDAYAGGTYHEICNFPVWNLHNTPAYGSKARAGRRHDAAGERRTVHLHGYSFRAAQVTLNIP
jgi:hypothetical protein